MTIRPKCVFFDKQDFSGVREPDSTSQIIEDVSSSTGEKSYSDQRKTEPEI